jgi:hypothetical protein
MKARLIRVAVSLISFAVGAEIVQLTQYSAPIVSDVQLTRTFYAHETEFNRLAKMFDEDSSATTIASSYACLKIRASWIYLDENQSWPLSESELGFTKQRWGEYRSLFRNLDLENGIERKGDIPDAIFFTAAMRFSDIDDAEYSVMEKGYVYSPQGRYDSLVDSLDGIKIDRPKIVFKRLNEKWYLYYQWSVGKPE